MMTMKTLVEGKPKEIDDEIAINEPTTYCQCCGRKAHVTMMH